VAAVDVGHGQLHPRVANDPRVAAMDGVNARYLEAGALGPGVALAVTDVSFISLKLILPAIDRILEPGGETVALIKPQFEAGRADVGRGGVVRDEAVRERVAAEIREFGERELGWEWLGRCTSPIKGPAGNVEFLSWWRKPGGEA
jgi:23S rRNA (cytidine1920-2'-O)/16S rRNA (cytidine1409-2'-O)-methyltransferase